MLSATQSNITRKSVETEFGAAIELHLGSLYVGQIYENWDGKWTSPSLAANWIYKPTQDAVEAVLIEALEQSIKLASENPVTSDLKAFYQQKLAA